LPDATEIYFADESGFEEYYSRTYGYASRGERVCGAVPGTRFSRTSVVGAINADNEFSAGFAFKGYMNGDLFCGRLECVFAPSLKNLEKSALIIDNASHHPKDKIEEVADEYGFRVIYLPKYSPDLNPVEKYWANIKNWLRLHLQKFDSFWDGLIEAFGVR
jgi:transposase